MGFLITAVAFLVGQVLLAPPASAVILEGNSFGIPGNNASFDYVVIGGGQAGLVMAARLSENPDNLVAVIEAGSFYERDNGNLSQIPNFDIYWTGKDPEDYNPLIDWGFTTTPQAGMNGNVSHYARGKTLGGCSARNYMAYHRSTVGAYQQWADEVGDQSYTFPKWLPYFEKSLRFTPPNNWKRGFNATPRYNIANLGNGRGPLRITFENYALAFSTWFAEALTQIGLPVQNGFTDGVLNGSSFTVKTINHETGARESSQTAFLQPALGRPNLIVYHRTLAKRILFNGKTATGVQVQTETKTYQLTAKKEVILSAGAFQSPQLLMVSGIGPAATLQSLNIPVVADRPGVGQNMWDHILFGPSYRVDVPTSSSFGDPGFFYKSIDEFRNEQGGMLSNNGGDLIAFERIPPALQSNWTAETKADLASFPSDWPEIEYLTIAGFQGYQNNYIRDAPTDGYNYATISVGLVKPLSRGNISISSADMNDQPLINPNWLTHPTDQAVAVAAYKRARAAWTSPAMQKITIGPEYWPGSEILSDADVLQLIKGSFNTIYHAAGTCAMGNNTNPNAVVDNHTKVFGVNNLRVVDASAFPFLPPGHPMATIYALAEKIADDIDKGL